MKQQVKILLVTCSYILACVSLPSCKASREMTATKSSFPAFMKIGHRGTRGLMPENTIPAMEKGIEAGANTVEMDVHVTKDGKVIVYHDESFNPDYTTMPDGSDIPKQQREKYTFYQMNYNEIRKFIIGKKDYPAYPQQKKFASYTPLLSELIDSVEAYAKAKNLPAPFYLIEVKSKEKTDGIEQPAPEEFMKVLMDVLKHYKLGNRLIIQSFDMRPLQVLHRTHPNVTLGFLTSDAKATVEQNLNLIGFNPLFYNPTLKLTTADLIKTCHSKGILVAPWTVNELKDMEKVKKLGVDGIITDYPNLFAELK